MSCFVLLSVRSAGISARTGAAALPMRRVYKWGDAIRAHGHHAYGRSQRAAAARFAQSGKPIARCRQREMRRTGSGGHAKLTSKRPPARRTAPGFVSFAMLCAHSGTARLGSSSCLGWRLSLTAFTANFPLFRSGLCLCEPRSGTAAAEAASGPGCGILSSARCYEFGGARVGACQLAAGFAQERQRAHQNPKCCARLSPARPPPEARRRCRHQLLPRLAAAPPRHRRSALPPCSRRPTREPGPTYHYARHHRASSSLARGIVQPCPGISGT